MSQRIGNTPAPVPQTPPAVNAPALPDLVLDKANFASSMRVVTENGQKVIRYSFGVGNRGPGHLILVGDRPGLDTRRFAATQLAYQGNELVEVRKKGFFEQDMSPGHRHTHYGDTARVSIEKVGGDHHASVTKSHFLMLDMYAVPDAMPRDPSIPAAVPSSVTFGGKNFRMGDSGASSLTVGQKIRSGFVDNYGPSLNDPLKLDPAGVDGEYLVKVEMDPGDAIMEVSEQNNVETFRVVVTNGVITSSTHVPPAVITDGGDTFEQ
jgi:hypothetical protein